MADTALSTVDGRIELAIVLTEDFAMMTDRTGLLPVTQLRREMNDLFQSVFRGWPFENGSAAFPALNIWEDDEALHVEAEMPGMALEDIEILVVGDELTIKGHRRAVEGRDMVFHRQERGVGEFSRTITLPTPINQDKVEAVLRHGVLNLTLPKAEAARPRKISVKAS
jgi:HSP20 family protein